MKYFIEKRYLKLYKKYKNGKISTEAFTKACERCQYTDKANQLHMLSSQGAWYVYENDTWQFDTYLRGTNKRRLNILAGYSKRRYLLKIVAVIVIFAFMTTIVFPGSVPRIKENVLTYLNIPRPYQSPEIEEKLTDSIVLTAPKGAVFKDQFFAAEEVSLDRAVEALAMHEIPYVPYYAFEFDAGLAADESFNKPVSLHVDLAEINIPEGGYDTLQVYRIADDGMSERLHTELQDDTLTIYSNSNSLVLIVTVPILVALTGYLVKSDIYDKYGGIFSDYKKLTIADPKYSHYNIWYDPETIKFESELAYNHPKLKQVMKRHGLIWSDERQSYTLPDMANIDKGVALTPKRAEAVKKIINALYADPDYLQIKQEINDVPIPVKAAILLGTIKNAHDYLYDVRNFKRVEDLNIILQSSALYQGGTAEAYYTSATIDDPYIAVPVDALNNNNKDNLQITITHELFHAIQKGYKYFLRDRTYDGYGKGLKDSRFPLQYDEALAIVLENEAIAYYEANGIAKGEDNTPEKIQYTNSLNTGWFDDKTTSKEAVAGYQDYGYGVGFILEYEKAAFKGDQLEFLHSKLQAMGTQESIDAIYAGYDKALFYEYANTKEGFDLLTRLEDQVTVISKPDVDTETIVDDQPLSFLPYTFKVDQGLLRDDYQRKHAVLLHYKDLSTHTTLDRADKHIFYNYQISGKSVTYDEMAHDFGFYAVPIESLLAKDSATGQQIHKMYLIDDYKHDSTDNQMNQMVGSVLGEANEKDKIITLLAVPPAEPIDLTYDEDSMMFKVELEKESANASELRQGRYVELTIPDTDIKPYQLYIEPGETEGEVHLMDMLLNEGDHVSKGGSKIVTSMVKGLMENNIRLGASQLASLSKGLLIAYWDSGRNAMNIRINENYRDETATDEWKNPYQLIKKLSMPTSVDLSVAADKKYMIVKILTDTPAYLNISYDFNDLFQYMRYVTLGSSSTVNMDKAIKRLKELDEGSVLHCKVRTLYGSENDPTAYQYADKAEDIYHKNTQLAVLGPESEEKQLKLPAIGDLPPVIPAATYRGSLMVRFITNLDTEIPRMMVQSRDKRYVMRSESEMDSYKENYADTLKELAQEKGSAAVNERLNDKANQIEEDFTEDEKEFDEDFQKDFTEVLNAINGIYYVLHTPVNMEGEATLIVSSTVASEDSSDDLYKGVITQGSSKGKYIFTVVGEAPVKLIITPKGDIIIESFMTVFKK